MHICPKEYTEADRMLYNKPFLKWAGGKYRLLNRILDHLPKSNRLVEPFGGSGAIFVNAPHLSFLIADDNLHLIELYNQLQQEGLSFIEYCSTFFTPETNTAEFYYKKRVAFNTENNPRERAALFLYLNRHGFNGLCRYNKSGIFNVPFGRYIKPYFPLKEMLHFHQKSQNAIFVQQDFRKTFANLEPNDVIYCDPPYVSLSPSAHFSSYTSKGFTEQDQIHLATLAQEACNSGHNVVISNHDTIFTRQHYANSTIKSFKIRRPISCKTKGGRLIAKELVAIFKPI